MSTTADQDDLFWDSDGLRHVSELIKDQVGDEQGKRFTQAHLCKLSGVSTGNLSSLLKNRNNREGLIHQKPSPHTLLRLAPHILDPETKQAFDPVKFLMLACKLRDRLLVLTPTPVPPAHLQRVKLLIESVLQAEQISFEALAESMRLDLAEIKQPGQWLQALIDGRTVVTTTALYCLARRIPLDGHLDDVHGWAQLFDLDLAQLEQQQSHAKPSNGHKAKKKAQA